MTTFNAFYKVAVLSEGNIIAEVKTASLTTATETFKEYEERFREYKKFLKEVNDLNDYVSPYYIEFWVINNDNRNESIRINCTNI